METKHLDPPRYPKLLLPIENGMKRRFDIILDKIKIDLSRTLVREIKK